MDETTLTPLQILWINLCQLKKCVWCRQKWPDGIVRKHPEARDAICLFKPDYLVHVQQTHGYEPEDIDMFIGILTTKDGKKKWEEFQKKNEHILNHN